jgi:signal transduction histidine kinase
MFMLPDYRIRQRDHFLEIALALTQELDLDKLLGRILDVSIEMLSGQAGLIALRSLAGGWRVRVSQALPPAFLRYIEPVLARIPPSTDNPETAEIPEISRLLKDITSMASLGMLNGVGLPLVARSSVVGVIFIFRSYPDLFSVNDRALLRSFANQAAIAVQNAQLYRQINQEKQRVDAMLESAADGIIILTPDRHIERCNAAFARLIGSSSSEIINKSHDEIITWAAQPQGLTLDQAEAGGWPLTPHAYLYVEGDICRSNNQPNLPIGITYAPVLSPEGALVNIIATVRDITRFREADQVKSTFISVISHELKTPVALIKGYVGTLRREDADWDPAIMKDSLQVIEEEADRLTSLIENLLDASRLQAGGMTLKRSDINFPTLVKRIVSRFQTQTDKHTFQIDFPEDFPIILADENRLTQVVSNLISNAIKYSLEGEIRIFGQVRPTIVIIGVNDQGPGIAPEDIPHVFDRFYRSPDMARITKGAGLGLYLSKAIVEAHGGRIWVDTEANKGASFYFSLPRQVDSE